MADGVLGAITRFIVWLNKKLFPYGLGAPDGCPNCGFITVSKPNVETCPFCEWGPEQEPTKTPEEARTEFLKGVKEVLWR